MITHIPFRLFPLVGFMFLCGCQALKPRPDPSQFFTLTASQVQEDVTLKASAPILVVMPPELPTYLRRPQWVGRDASGELHLHEYRRWAEPLDEAFARVFRCALRKKAQGTADVRGLPVYGEATAYIQVEVDVFEPQGDNVVLKGLWRIVSAKGNHMFGSASFALNEPLGKERRTAQADAMGHLIERLAEQVDLAVLQPEK